MPIFFCLQPFKWFYFLLRTTLLLKAKIFLWILTLLCRNGSSNCLLRNTDHVTIACLRLVEFKLYNFSLVAVIPREVKKEKTQNTQIWYFIINLYFELLKWKHHFLPSKCYSIYRLAVKCIFTGSVKLRSKNTANCRQTESWNGNLPLCGRRPYIVWKNICFYPRLANWIKYHFKFFYVEVVKRRNCYKMLYLQQSILLLSVLTVLFPFSIYLQTNWVDTIQTPFWVQPWICKLNLEYCSIQLPVFVKVRSCLQSYLIINCYDVVFPQPMYSLILCNCLNWK